MGTEWCFLSTATELRTLKDLSYRALSEEYSQWLPLSHLTMVQAIGYVCPSRPTLSLDGEWMR